MSNATAEAIASLDFLRDEWLVFGNRLAEFVAANVARFAAGEPVTCVVAL